MLSCGLWRDNIWKLYFHLIHKTVLSGSMFLLAFDAISNFMHYLGMHMIVLPVPGSFFSERLRPYTRSGNCQTLPWPAPVASTVSCK